MHRNLTALYGFRFFRDFLLIAPVIIPFYRANGLSATQILVLQALFSAAVLVCEIPSGYLSDRWGRRRTLLLGGMAITGGLGLYSSMASFAGFIPAELLLGFGFSMCSGTESALLYDTLAVLGRTGDYRRIESRAEFATRLGAAVSSITGGLLASFGLRLPFYVNTATATMLPLTAVMLREPVRRRPQSARIWQDIRQAVQHSVRDRHIRSAALITGAILTTGIIAIWGYFLLLADLGVPLAWYGVLFFLFQTASAVGARASHAVTQRTGRRGALLLFLGIPAIFLVIGAVPVQGLLLLAFVQSFLWGLSTPFFLDIINARAIPELRATVLSTVSMGGRLLYVLAGPLFGMIVDAAGVRAGFVFLTIVLGICLSAALALRHAARPQRHVGTGG